MISQETRKQSHIALTSYLSYLMSRTLLCSTLFFDIILLVINLIETKYFIIYFLVINIISFLIMGYDKYLAKRNKWRISENMLFFFSAILGSLGTFIGMHYFRHKTKHIKFVIGIPIMFILNAIITYYILIVFKLI